MIRSIFIKQVQTLLRCFSRTTKDKKANQTKKRKTKQKSQTEKLFLRPTKGQKSTPKMSLINVENDAKNDAKN
jgi:hypothetical protein